MLENFEVGVNSHTHFIKLHHLVQNFLKKKDGHGHDGNKSLVI
jgi:hypothetical protein